MRQKLISAACFALALAMLLVATRVWTPVDDSDQSWWVRSGFDVRTDNKTGCQYLSRWFALTPRLDATGKQVCGRTVERAE